jgi:hypothetical protein
MFQVERFTFTMPKCKVFAYCLENQVTNPLNINFAFIRSFILFLKEKGHNDGGVFAFYRAVKTYLLWYEDEFEPENWKNPIRKVLPRKHPSNRLREYP